MKLILARGWARPAICLRKWCAAKLVDHRADIFAFGAVLYEMLAGKRAFQHSTSAETMTAILHEDPPAISQIARNAPPGLQRVVHRCLEKNAERRFQSASDLAFALEALSESGISSPHLSNGRNSDAGKEKPGLVHAGWPRSLPPPSPPTTSWPIERQRPLRTTRCKESSTANT